MPNTTLKPEGGTTGARGDHVDRLGAAASSLCAVHCVLAAVLPAAFGVLGLGLLLTEEAEWVLVALAIAFASGALVLGWRQHRSVAVAVTLVLGIAGLLASRGLEMASGDHHHGRAEAHHETDHAQPDHAQPDHAQPDHAQPDHAEPSWHGVGPWVGAAAGLFLLLGHVSNQRASRRCREACRSSGQATQHPS